MIAYLRGRLLRQTEHGVVVESGGVGYEVVLPEVVRRTLGDVNGEVELHVTYHASANQPRPVLIGFLREIEREFFERFITVDGMGPTKAARAIVQPIHRIADAIETKDVQFLRRLSGIGPRLAEKIVATLHGKMGKYALLQDAPVEVAEPAPPGVDEITAEVLEILTKQLGHRVPEARRMVDDALRRRPEIDSAEALFQEVYRGERGGAGRDT